MGQGTTPPAPAVSAAPASTAATPNQPALSDNQVKAIAMLMGQLGKGASGVAGMQGQPIQQTYPQTSTLQGGTYFNPQQPR
jgi:hypothetical protein